MGIDQNPQFPKNMRDEHPAMPVLTPNHTGDALFLGLIILTRSKMMRNHARLLCYFLTTKLHVFKFKQMQQISVCSPTMMHWRVLPLSQKGLPENTLPPNPIKTAISWAPPSIPPDDVAVPGLLCLQTMRPCSGFTQRRRLEVVVAALPIALQKGQAVVTPFFFG